MLRTPQFVVLILLALFFSGCADLKLQHDDQSVLLKEQVISLIELKAIIKEVIPLGVRTISPNGREFDSQVFLFENNQYIPAKDATVRYWAKMIILNESRPYDIEIEVRVERRTTLNGRTQFVSDKVDMSLARLLRTQLKDRLSKRREDLNLLDDFRVF
jgi:hypothetical protein